LEARNVKIRAYMGTINRHPDEADWRNIDLDVSSRGIWDHDLNMAVNPDFVCDITDLTIFRDETFDAVVLNHVLEHLSYEHAHIALSEIIRVLKTGGELDIEVPDAERVTAAWIDGDLDDAGFAQWIYGEQLAEHEPGDSHRYAWTERTLRLALEKAGFRVGDRSPTGLALRFRVLKLP
jgi:predicted SAM-dependent methyltransferase